MIGGTSLKNLLQVENLSFYSDCGIFLFTVGVQLHSQKQWITIENKVWQLIAFLYVGHFYKLTITIHAHLSLLSRMRKQDCLLFMNKISLLKNQAFELLLILKFSCVSFKGVSSVPRSVQSNEPMPDITFGGQHLAVKSLMQEQPLLNVLHIIFYQYSQPWLFDQHFAYRGDFSPPSDSF